MTPFLATDFALSEDFTLERVFGGFFERESSSRNWRMCGDTIMFWLDRAVDQEMEFHGDFDFVDQFLERCVTDTPQMRKWYPDQHTSAETRKRAQFYLNTLLDESGESDVEQGVYL